MIETLIDNLERIFPKKLVSVVLYGSSAVENCTKEFSDINLIVVIDKLEASDLKNANPLLKKWKKNPIPLFMDKDEWFNSCDVYPVEYSDIKDRYKILYGEDVVAPLVLEKSNLRLQCEHEVKNLLIKLRQVYLTNCNDRKAIENLIKSSSKTFNALFRAILKLSCDDVPFKHEDVIEKLAEKVGFDKDLFLKILEFRANSKAIHKDEFDTVIQKMIDSTDFILKYVDKFEQ